MTSDLPRHIDSTASDTGTAAAADTTPTTGRLGSLTVRRIGYGAMQLAGPGVFGPPADPVACVAVLRRAVELGIDHIDTAQFYGPDVTNRLIREALHPYSEHLVLATKIGAERDDQGAWLPAGTPEQLVAQVELNLHELGTERLGLVNLRRFELDAPGMEQPALEDQLGALEGLREQGKIAELGISNVGAEVVRRAAEITRIASVQNPYSLLDRSQQDVLDLSRELGIAFVPFFPLGSAFTGGPSRLAADPHVAAVAERHGASASQVALAWLLALSENVLLIPGTASVAHLEENLRAGELTLSAEDLQELDQVPPQATGPQH